MKILDIEALLRQCADVPDWRLDPSDPAAAMACQTLIGIASTTGLFDVLEGRMNELLERHGNITELIDDWNFITREVADELQLALVGTTLGKECQEHEMESGQLLEHLRKGNTQ
jgi:hypothetical protein